jgi:hypothetical protein
MVELRLESKARSASSFDLARLASSSFASFSRDKRLARNLVRLGYSTCS